METTAESASKVSTSALINPRKAGITKGTFSKTWMNHHNRTYKYIYTYIYICIITAWFGLEGTSEVISF